jgi:glutamate formiminotransferase / 5-formyltetrahydrofolate cyclo-ligase
VLEAVPNVSEGRDRAAVVAIGEAFSRGGARLLDVHSDADHHRSVLTLAAGPDVLADALVAGTAVALEAIDLRHHDGVHPRVGAVDVVPVVPILGAPMSLACEVALAVAGRIGGELEVPVLLYGEVGGGLRPAHFRRGGLEELARRVEAGEIAPYAGPGRISPRSGVVLVGAREPLVAYNVELATSDVARAREIAATVRESGGGLPGVQAIGLLLPRSGRVQVSMNVLDLERSPLHLVVAEVARLAGERGVEVSGGELVGLVPEGVLAAATKAGASIPGVDESRVLERLLAL